MKNTDASPSTIKAVETMISIVDILSERGEGTITGLASEVDLAKSTVYKHLNTLERLGYVIKEDNKFRLSYKFLTIGGAMRDQQRICRLARPKLRELAENTEMMVVFALMERDRGVFVFRINERFGIGNSIPLGLEFCLHENAAGKAILAELPRPRIESIIDSTGMKQQTPLTITERDELLGQLKVIRERGYAINMGERKEKLRAVGTSVIDPETEQPYSFSVAGPASRITEERIPNLGEAVSTTADELELQLEYG